MRTWFGGFGTTGHDDNVGVFSMVDVGSDHDEDEGRDSVVMCDFVVGCEEREDLLIHGQ